MWGLSRGGRCLNKSAEGCSETVQLYLNFQLKNEAELNDLQGFFQLYHF